MNIRYAVGWLVFVRDHRSFKEGCMEQERHGLWRDRYGLSDNSMLTLGGTYQKNKDIPDFARRDFTLRIKNCGLQLQSCL